MCFFPDLESNRFIYFILVSNCLDVMIRCIDNSASIEMISRFYSTLNESTCQSSCQWMIFMDTCLMLMGFPDVLRQSLIEVIDYLFFSPFFSFSFYPFFYNVIHSFIYPFTLSYTHSYSPSILY